MAMLATNDPGARSRSRATLHHACKSLRHCRSSKPRSRRRPRLQPGERNKCCWTPCAATRNMSQHSPATKTNSRICGNGTTATKQLSSVKLPADEVQTIWAARLALALAQFRPENAAYQRQALVLGFESAALARRRLVRQRQSRDQPQFEQLVAAADTTMLNNVLSDSLKGNYINAAVAAARLLAKRGDAGSPLRSHAATGSTHRCPRLSRSSRPVRGSLGDPASSTRHRLSRRESRARNAWAISPRAPTNGGPWSRCRSPIRPRRSPAN